MLGVPALDSGSLTLRLNLDENLAVGLVLLYRIRAESLDSRLTSYDYLSFLTVNELFMVDSVVSLTKFYAFLSTSASDLDSLSILTRLCRELLASSFFRIRSSRFGFPAYFFGPSPFIAAITSYLTHMFIMRS